MANDIMKIEFTPDQEQLIRKQIAPNANKDELQLFLYQCKRTGLDPLTRQIYCIHRGGKMTIQTSIDGFRVVAERSGSYAGQDEPIFVEDEKGNIISCKVTVYKFSANGQRYPAAVGVAYWSEYAQAGPMWTKMKHTMISKCAEALALRKAFPQDLSGLYTTEEMQQADAPKTEDVEPIEEITDIEKKLLQSLVYGSDLEDHEKEAAFEAIENCNNYKRFEQIRYKLEARQLTIDQMQNPNQSDINNHLKKVVG
jgi:phage recombination protein Bet